MLLVDNSNRCTAVLVIVVVVVIVLAVIRRNAYSNSDNSYRIRRYINAHTYDNTKSK